ncbi:AsnC family transcriptional regulator [Brevibacillus ruminantium]|uniref:AsnC family transcriptional regulator n=1 Tax=Brevibacillus ruminantium TaxID=2950604 RepID=A0ABY4W980_9BACL|nr:winged helix-turn-helix transcriptional regulator [Brevibacillus ruminantium]USG63732.1 AsnC family transcriptional regulator [Brevibacillus ruminantium]
MLDYTDKRILEELAKDGRISMKKLGEKVHLSGQAAANRLAKLEDDQVIEGYTVRLNYKKTGYTVHSFITILTRSFDHQPLFSFLGTKCSFILNRFKISGEGCYLLECRFPSNEELDIFLGELSRYANYRLNIVVSEF